MASALDHLIREQEEELQRLCRDEPHKKGAAQRVHEYLTLLRAAKYAGQWHDDPVADIERPEAALRGSIDLAFRCGDRRYAIEHTTIESFDGQRAWTETGVLHRPLPGSVGDLPETRRAAVAAAFDRKLDKLARYAAQVRQAWGNCTSVLLLEFEDYWHSGDYAFLKAVGDALPSCRNRLPEKLYLLGTVYRVEGDVRFLEACLHVPTSKVIYSLDLEEYRLGNGKATLHGPVNWFDHERDWFTLP